MAKRLDLFLVESGLASTRTKAQELISTGLVIVDGRQETKAGRKVDPGSRVELVGTEHPYVSRGGLKLEAALRLFSINLKDQRVLDIGQSTGGFTHCALRSGAASVVGIEVGRDQLAADLRADPRVTCLEKQDIRSLDPKRVAPEFSVFLADLSFISLEKVVPVIPAFLSPVAEGVLLVKPQFEVGRDLVGSGGIVRDAAARELAVGNIRRICEAVGFTVAGLAVCPVAGGDGNLEYLMHLCWQ